MDMKQLGIPVCPYCGKHVNLVRMWTLKRDGEYVCPYCNGISNVRHAPFMNIFAAVCGVISLLIFTFTQLILNKSSFMTCVYVFLPFVVFFVGSMFMVQLLEPVVRQGKRESIEARRDAAVMRRRQKEAIAAAGAAPARTPAAAPNPNPNTNPNRAPRVYTELRPQEAPAQPQPVAQPRRQPAAREYTDISSASGRGSTQARQTRQQPVQNSRDIYSSSRGQGYAYSTSAHLRNQDEAAAEERRRKIELLKQLQREQNQEYQSSQNNGRNGQ